MSDDFDEILASGDDEAIAAALDEAEISGELLFGEEAEEELPGEEVETPVVEKEVAEEVIDETPSDKNNVAATVDKAIEAAPESLPAEDENKSNVIEQDGKIFVEVSKDNAELDSKNGKHKLPFDLLAGTREENLALKRQIDEQAIENAELQSGLDETKRVAELHSKQLSEAGLDPKLLPEQMLKDPELMAQIKEDYPQIGELVEVLASQLQANPVEQAPVETTVETTVETPAATEQTPVQEAFAQTTHLKEWQTGDADRWQMATMIDAKLANDPSFENKTISERLTEVEKRVMNAFGDVTKVEEAPADKVETPASKSLVQSQKAPIPNSPTDIGHQGSDMSANSQLLDQDAATMAASMEGMSDAQIEDLLEGASDFL